MIWNFFQRMHHRKVNRVKIIENSHVILQIEVTNIFKVKFVVLGAKSHSAELFFSLWCHHSSDGHNFVYNFMASQLSNHNLAYGWRLHQPPAREAGYLFSTWKCPYCDEMSELNAFVAS